MFTTATIKQLNTALDYVNTLYDDNIVFKSEPILKGNRIHFTLTVKDSSAAGSRIGNSGRRVKAACWHVHGHFFEFLFDDGVELIIVLGKYMKSNADNWKDWEVSYAYNMSQLCNC